MNTLYLGTNVDNIRTIPDDKGWRVVMLLDQEGGTCLHDVVHSCLVSLVVATGILKKKAGDLINIMMCN